ncbi:DASS family sodium-coupled anion symporter [Streptomyces sp. ST2-7A]|uniref:SLC13 family permease n=1 Tax=Streptomyces sp. ST2-7A TaxID=2907214 RepID=UPI001F3BF90B|nr:DASS family sodium-coupled anion symporter [Streptomyces sp. ST2-7A]MCE7080961.1 DASS family sodium-coupled anion symporter [Streptomyces sp. ST2-7A]
MATTETPTAETRARHDAGPRPGATEEHLPRRRMWLGRVLGPVLALAAYHLIPADPDLSTAARTALAVVVLVAVWWMTEALPLAATSLVPIVALPLLGIFPVAEAAAPYANPIVFLFLGGFVIALAMQKWNLHRRIALLTMRAIGTRPKQLMFGVMAATWFLSMWVSNTATTLMMLPIGTSVLALVTARRTADGDTGEAADTADTGAAADGAVGPARKTARDGATTAVTPTAVADRDVRNFSVCMMLGIAYAATIGGLATLIGSPPNLIMSGIMEESHGVSIGFADWMMLGVPLSALFLVIAWLFLTRVAYPTGLSDVMGGREVIQRELDDLGPMSRGEWTVLSIFASTALLWVFREPLTEWSALTSVLPFMAHLDDTVIAIAAVVALFLIPVDTRRGVQTMDWRTVQSGVPWGVLLLFGGGLALAKAVQETGLAAWIGTKMDGLGTLPVVLLIAAVCLIILMLTELTSNTATASTFLPVLAAVAVGIAVDPLLLAVPAAMAATCSFMLPVGTPPNAIVFGSGHVTMAQMVRAGLWLNLIGVVLITVMTLLLGGWAMGIVF